MEEEVEEEEDEEEKLVVVAQADAPAEGGAGAGAQVGRLQAQAAAPVGMAAVHAMLVALRLEQYSAAFEGQGYDDLEFLSGCDAEQLAQAARDVGMKQGHSLKLSHWLPRYRPP